MNSSRSDESEEDEEDESEQEEENGDAGPSSRSRKHRGEKHDGFKKPVLVDSNGIPYGIMKTCLADDVKLLAKDLDPTVGWDSQPGSEKKRFFARLYAGITVSLSHDNHMLKICAMFYEKL